MTLQLWFQTDESGPGWTPFEENGVSDFVLEVSYAHPARLSWQVHRPQHERPIPDRAAILFVDTDYGSLASAVFEGHVHEIQPIGTRRILYVAYDATRRAGHEVTILSGPIVFPNVIPRLVYNAKIEADDDYAFERDHDKTVGRIIEDLLTDPYATLVSLLAAPPVEVGGPAYEIADLELLDYRPQEKLVFETEGLRSGLDRMLALYPQYRLQFIPGFANRKWRIRNVFEAPQITLTLNRTDDSGGPVVLAMSLERSLEQRYTAVEILGPPKTAMETAAVSEGSDCSSGSSGDGCGLEEMWTLGEELTFLSMGPGTPGTEMVSRQWRVANPVKRQLARLLPEPIFVAMDEFLGTGLAFKESRLPTLEATFDGGTTWKSISGIRLDVNRGLVTAPFQVFERDGSGEIVLPDDVRFTFAHYVESLSARWPDDGYSGTAFTEAGLELVLQRYDEALAAGYDYDRPVSEFERVAQFQKLARNIQEARRDVVYAGGCVLAGIDYEFLRLQRRINFDAVDADGEPIETGWESIDAILTDVEYDYSRRLTTLSFSSDHLEFAQRDPEALKRTLKIQALQRPPNGIRIVYDGLGVNIMSSLL